MKRTMPRAAGWLLERFGVPAHNECLMGDLAEEYASGRSRLWFWKETLIAITAAAARDIRDHKILTIRALALAGVLNLIFTQVKFRAALPLYLRSGRQSWAGILLFALGWLCPLVVGWAVVQTHRARQAAVLMALCTATLLLNALYFWWVMAYLPKVFLFGIVEHTCTVLLLTLAGGLLSKPLYASKR